MINPIQSELFLFEINKKNAWAWVIIKTGDVSGFLDEKIFF